ncbi:MAG TPA: serine hydrolase, partial [Pseudonocardiaceae bacterium]
VLDRRLARLMLTVAPDSPWGLGCTVVPVPGGDLEFGHQGRLPGYRATLAARLGSGAGLVALTNGDGGADVLTALADRVRSAAPTSPDRAEAP